MDENQKIEQSAIGLRVAMSDSIKWA